MTKIFFAFFKIGLFTFGGGYSMIPLIHYYAVDKYKWIDEKEFIDIIAIAESTPGPIAINSATYVGYKTNKTIGSIMATLGVVLPSIIIITLISAFLMTFKENQIVEYAFMGIRVGVSVLILNAGLRIYKKLPKNLFTYIIMVSSFILAFLDIIPIVFIILIGGVIGILSQVLLNKEEVKADD